MRRKTLYLTLVAAMTLVYPCSQEAAAETPLDAATKQVKREYRKSPKGDGALTKGMIESCIRLKIDVDASYTEIDKAKNQFEALNKEVTELGERLKAMKKKIDETGDKQLRATYDNQVQVYNNKLPGLDGLLEKYRKMVDTYEEKSTKFEQECNGQPYYEDDYEAVVKKMGRGM